MCRLHVKQRTAERGELFDLGPGSGLAQGKASPQLIPVLCKPRKHCSEGLHIHLLVLTLPHCSGFRQITPVALSLIQSWFRHHGCLRGVRALLQGADWFESVLVDYDVCSNWGNWVAAAGLTGGRINHFNITKQSKVALAPPNASLPSASGLHFRPPAHRSAAGTAS